MKSETYFCVPATSIKQHFKIQFIIQSYKLPRGKSKERGTRFLYMKF